MSVKGITRRVARELAAAERDRRPISNRLVDSILKEPSAATKEARDVLSSALSRHTTAFEPAARQALSGYLANPASTTGSRRRMTFVYDPGDHDLDKLELKGSFNPTTGAFDAGWNGGAGIPMTRQSDGTWAVTLELLDDGQPHDWKWDVTGVRPSGERAFVGLTDGPRSFTVDGAEHELVATPTTYHRLGAHLDGNDLAFEFWAPNARDVHVKVLDDAGNPTRYPMIRDPSGTWTADVPDGASLVGKRYVYEIATSDGQTVDRLDPYARETQTEARGVSRLSLDSTDFLKFEVDDDRVAAAKLVLRDASGNALSKADLLARLGSPSAQFAQNETAGRYSDFWARHVDEKGRIDLIKVGGSLSAIVNNPDALFGLSYTFETVNGARSLGNDPYDNKLSPEMFKPFRASVITSTQFDWKSEHVPRERDHRKWVTEQVHVGSFLGSQGNSHRSTFRDLSARLDHFKELGVNNLELLPVNEFEGGRDWGYYGVNGFAVESSYGFQDDDGRWVNGAEALKRFIDAAHAKGINVSADLVDNHVGGANNPLKNLDGPEDPYFRWQGDPAKANRDTMWGPMMAFNRERPKQLLVDHAVAQVEEFHFDGLRFDFVEPMHAGWEPSPDGKWRFGGSSDGRDLLRDINRKVHFFKPDAFTVAEQFDYDVSMTRPVNWGGDGAGFDAQWYSEYHHKLIGVLNDAASGRQPSMKSFVDMLAQPRGLDGWGKAMTIFTNHDEAGWRIAAATAGGTDRPIGQWAQNAARLAAGVALLSPGRPIFLSGEESLAQRGFAWGNPASWDLEWGWKSIGSGWNWDELTFSEAQRGKYERLAQLSSTERARDAEYLALNATDRSVCDTLAGLPDDRRTALSQDIQRRQTFNFYKDVLGERARGPASRADAEVRPVYAHDENRVMAFSRRLDGEEIVVVSNLAQFGYPGYGMELPPGQWQIAFNSDEKKYGGEGTFTQDVGTRVGGGFSRVSLPPGGVVVLKRVG